MQDKIIVHRLLCDICGDDIEDAGEVLYAKDMRNWVKECGWGYHNKKDYCPLCEQRYIRNKTIKG